MKKLISIVIAVIVVAGVIVGFVVANNNSGGTKNPNDDMGNMNMNKQPTNNNQNPTATNSVSIANFAFSPASITVKKGTTVTWTNNDSTTHTVSENDGQAGPNSGNLNPGKSYSFTFTTVGTFKYHCAIHPDMIGTVTVTE